MRRRIAYAMTEHELQVSLTEMDDPQQLAEARGHRRRLDRRLRLRRRPAPRDGGAAPPAPRAARARRSSPSRRRRPGPACAAALDAGADAIVFEPRARVDPGGRGPRRRQRPVGGPAQAARQRRAAGLLPPRAPGARLRLARADQRPDRRASSSSPRARSRATSPPPSPSSACAPARRPPRSSSSLNRPAARCRPARNGLRRARHERGDHVSTATQSSTALPLAATEGTPRPLHPPRRRPSRADRRAARGGRAGRPRRRLHPRPRGRGLRAQLRRLLRDRARDRRLLRHGGAGARPARRSGSAPATR